MDYEQAGKAILCAVFVILLASLFMVRRGMKAQDQDQEAPRLAGASLHTMQDIHATLREIAGYLKPQVRIAETPAPRRDPARAPAQKPRNHGRRQER